MSDASLAAPGSDAALAPDPTPPVGRYLLSCFACDPNAGSEPYVGWQWASKVYAGETRIVLTRRHHRAALSGREAEGLSFRYFDLPFLSGLDHRHRLMKLYYILWQICVLPYAAAVVWCSRLTHVHHITYNAVDFPGMLWAIPFVRFLWGPVGGGQTPPDALRRYYGESWRRQRFRNLMKRALWCNPLVRVALWRSSLTLTANSETYRRLAPLAGRGRVERMLETAVSEAEGQERTPHAPLRVIWVGRFEARKAPGLLVEVAEALGWTHPGKFSFTMIGGGELLGEIREAGRGMPHLELRGEIPFEAMRAAYAAADVLAFTSLQDTSGNVVLEALAAGMPVVALDHQGSADILPAGGGLLVPVAEPAAVVAGFAAALTRLLSPEAYGAASRGALDNILRNHTWAQKAAAWRQLR